MKKGQVVVGELGGEVTRVELLTNPTKRGRATVRIIESGMIEAKEGHVIKGFELTHGVVKFKEE